MGDTISDDDSGIENVLGFKLFFSSTVIVIAR